MAAAAPTLKRLSFELGGNGAILVFEDADIDSSVRWSVDAAFANAGQACIAGPRLLVHESIADEWLMSFRAAVDRLALGDPREESMDVGPLSSEEHFEKVSDHLVAAIADGAHAHTSQDSPPGWFIAPTLLTGVADDAPAWREEIFGPVAALRTFASDEEAVASANDTPYGLSAAVFTREVGRAHRVAHAMHAGQVWVNCYRIRDARAPFGGWKDSGIGREGGRYSRDLYTEAKSVFVELS